MTGLVLPDAGTDLAGFVLAVADLREKRAGAVPPPVGVFVEGCARHVREHIAAEANPAHVLAEVALWRGIAETHGPWVKRSGAGRGTAWCRTCEGFKHGDCPTFRHVVAAARAYLGEQQQ